MHPALRFLARLLHRVHRAYLWVTRPLTLGVRLILVRDGRVLLVRHTYHDGWLLPGGGVEKGETIEAAARREAREELGVELAALRLHGVYTNFHEFKSDHVTVFSAIDVPPPAPQRSFEIERAEFFPLDDLPADLLAGHRRRLEEYHRPDHQPCAGRW